jgi:hypothetical protein
MALILISIALLPEERKTGEENKSDVNNEKVTEV